LFWEGVRALKGDGARGRNGEMERFCGKGVEKWVGKGWKLIACMPCRLAQGRRTGFLFLLPWGYSFTIINLVRSFKLTVWT